MKRFFIVISVILTLILCLSAVTACDNGNDPVPDKGERVVKVTAAELKEKAYFDLDKHPDLADNGLFWVGYDEAQGGLFHVLSDNVEEVKSYGTKLFDPNKPTIVNIHGIQMDSYFYDLEQYQESLYGIYNANSTMLKPTVYNYDTPNVNLLKLWLDNGFNVLTFDYYRLSDEPTADTVPAGEENGAYSVTCNKTIEARCWSTEGPQKMRYRKRDGSWSCAYNADGEIVCYDCRYKGDSAVGTSPEDYTGDYEELPYCIAEYFAGYWLRALDYYDITAKEVRWACHSMGGSVTTSTAFLLSQLVKEGDVAATVLPQRLSFEDPYFGVGYSGVDLVDKMEANSQLPIIWTGELPEGDTTAYQNYVAIQQLVEDYDVAIEMFYAETAVSQISTNRILALINQYVVMTYYNNTAVSMTAHHNGVRECYLGSIIDQPILIEGSETQKAIFATTSIETIKAERGNMYIQTDDNGTGRANDDTYVRGCTLAVISNDGKLGKVAVNQQFVAVPTGTAVKVEATKNYAFVEFDGWYNLKGEKVSSELIYEFTTGTEPQVLEARFN